MVVRRAVGRDGGAGRRGAPAASREARTRLASCDDRDRGRRRMRRWLSRPSRFPRGPRIVARGGPRGDLAGRARGAGLAGADRPTTAGVAPTLGANAGGEAPLPPGPGNPTKTFPSSPALRCGGIQPLPGGVRLVPRDRAARHSGRRAFAGRGRPRTGRLLSVDRTDAAGATHARSRTRSPPLYNRSRSTR